MEVKSNKQEESPPSKAPEAESPSGTESVPAGAMQLELVLAPAANATPAADTPAPNAHCSLDPFVRVIQIQHPLRKRKAGLHETLLPHPLALSHPTGPA